MAVLLAGVAAVAIIVGLALRATSAGGPVDELRARPTLIEVTARYEKLDREIRAAIDDRYGPQDWRQLSPQEVRECGEQFRGASALLLPGRRSGVVPGIDPAEAASIVRDVAVRHGLTERTRLVVQDDRRIEDRRDPLWGAELELEITVTIAFGVSSGCHRAGTP